MSRLNHHITQITSKALKSSWFVKTVTVAILASHMLWFNFILGLNFIFLFFKFIIIHYHTQKQRKTKCKPRIKLNYNTHKWINPWLTKLGWLTKFVIGLVLSFCWTWPFFRKKNPAILTSRLANFTQVAWMSEVSFSLTSGEMGKERRAKWNEENTESSGTQANSGEAGPQIVESKR